MNRRDPKQREESVRIPLDHLFQNGRDGGQFLDPAVAQWLIDHGVADDIADCEWWIDQVTGPPCIRVWIRNEQLRMLFKLTWGGA